MQDAGLTILMPETPTDGPQTTPEVSVPAITAVTQPPDFAPGPERERRYKQAVKRVLGQPKRGKTPDPWALTTLRSKQEIAKIFTIDSLAQVLLVDNISAKSRLDAAIALGQEMLDEGNLNPEIAFKGIAIIAAAVKIAAETTESILRVAERAGAKAESGNGAKRKNLPPSTGMEITMGEGADKVSVRAVATNGEAPSQ